MKRFLWVIVIGIAMVSMLCIGLALGVLLTPARVQIERAIGRIINRAETSLRIEPRVKIQVPETGSEQKESGILIAGVVSDSPAEKAGLRRGDILLAIDGEEVNTLAELQKIIRAHEPGDKVKLQVQRGDRKITVTATLEKAPGEETTAFLGIRPSNDDLGNAAPPEIRKFGIFRGARILEVMEDSPAEQAGLQAGQIITAVNGQPLRQAKDLNSWLAGSKPGERVELTVLQTDGEEKVVEVTLAENPDKPGAAWLGIRYSWWIQAGPEGLMPWMPEGGDGALPDLPRRWFETIPPEQLFPENVQPGALIQEVAADSPAEKAGLQAGQIIQAVDGKELDGPEALREVISGHEPGDAITLTVLDPRAEDAQTREVKVTLGENPEQAGAAWLGIRYVYLDFQRPNLENLPEG